MKSIKQLTISTKTLKILAALVWYFGGVVLILKGGSLLVEANTMHPSSTWSWATIIIGILLGTLKAIFIFVKSCKKNLARIEKLIEPKIWEFYRNGFFVALIIMIIIGSILSKIAHGNYILLLSVAILDISIAVALLVSSFVFWRKKEL